MIALKTWLLDLSGLDLLEAFNAGNPILQLLSLIRDGRGGGRLADSLFDRLWEYGLFHGVLTALCVTWAVLRLRAIFLRQADGQPSRTKRRERWALRPAVGSRPMLWKEIFMEGGLRFGLFGKLQVAGLVAGSFLLLIYFFDAMAPSKAAALTPYVITLWSMSIGCAVACLLLLGVGVHAANALSGERDRSTLDGLLTTPLTCGQILFAKSIGSVLSVRWGLLWLGTMWGLGAGAGILHIMVLPLWLLAWISAATLLALIGLWFSLVSRTSARALMYTILCAVTWAITPLVPYHYFFLSNVYDQPWVKRLYLFQLGASPPATLAYLLPFWRAGTTQPSPRGPTSQLMKKDLWEVRAALLGMALWALAAIFLWCLTSYYFRKQTGRRGFSPCDEKLAK